VVLVGQSYGTVLALEIAKARPDLLYAVVTQGLAANWLASVDIVREHLIEDALAKGDVVEAKRLRDLGPIPDPRDPEAVLAYGPKIGKPIPDEHTWHNIEGAGDGWAFREDTLKSVSPDLPPDIYAAQKEAFKADPGRFREAMVSVLPYDAYRDVGTVFQVPLIVMQGAFDWQTNRDLAKAYFNKVCAPWKKWDELPEAAHALNIEQPGLSVVSLVRDVLPAVQGQQPPGAETCRSGQ
jgi:pimeloyl-ACP methyl ester carboxylesterase